MVQRNKKFFINIFYHQVKCEKYWPEETGMYGDIKVTVKKTRTFADYVTRTFILEKVINIDIKIELCDLYVEMNVKYQPLSTQGNEHHAAQQFHFMSWPDYGVPLYPTQILTFRGHFKSYHETKTGPAVIHCR